jgi:hypothetical protein
MAARKNKCGKVKIIRSQGLDITCSSSKEKSQANKGTKIPSVNPNTILVITMAATAASQGNFKKRIRKTTIHIICKME